MATAADSAQTTDTSSSRPLVWSRIGSLLAMLPLGVWTVNHLWDNLSAFRGAEAWERSVTTYAHPASHFATLVIVLLPLLIHTVWGIQRLLASKPNNLRHNSYNNFKYLLQRVTALGALGFLAAHIFKAMIQPRLLNGAPETFEAISREMRFHGPTLVVYLLGTLGVAYHLANGLSSFAWTWGIASGRKSMKRFDVIAIASFLILLAMSWGAIYALYRAGEMYGPGMGH